jgi:hypothetical protein
VRVTYQRIPAIAPVTMKMTNIIAMATWRKRLFSCCRTDRGRWLAEKLGARSAGNGIDGSYAMACTGERASAGTVAASRRRVSDESANPSDGLDSAASQERCWSGVPRRDDCGGGSLRDKRGGGSLL